MNIKKELEELRDEYRLMEGSPTLIDADRCKEEVPSGDQKVAGWVLTFPPSTL